MDAVCSVCRAVFCAVSGWGVWGSGGFHLSRSLSRGGARSRETFYEMPMLFLKSLYKRRCLLISWHFLNLAPG